MLSRMPENGAIQQHGKTSKSKVIFAVQILKIHQLCGLTSAGDVYIKYSLQGVDLIIL